MRCVLPATALVCALAAGAATAFAQPLSISPQAAPATRAPSGGAPARAAVPLPPPRPADLAAPTPAAAPPATATAAPPATATAAPAPPPPRSAQAVQVGRDTAVEVVNGYLSSLHVLSGDFVQTGPDGRRVGGRIYVQKPGRMRFEYAPPSPIEIVADGTSEAIRNRKLATQDLYGIGQTPLKFLLRERIDLRRDTTLRGVELGADTVAVEIEDRSTLGGTSRITLVFTKAPLELRQWTVIDPQGYRTEVALSNLDTQARLDPRLFRIDYQRMIGDGR